MISAYYAGFSVVWTGWWHPLLPNAAFLFLKRSCGNGALPKNAANIQSKCEWNQEPELWCIFWTCQWCVVSWFRVTIFPEGQFNVPLFFPKCWIHNLKWLLGSVSIYLWKHCPLLLELICLRCHMWQNWRKLILRRHLWFGHIKANWNCPLFLCTFDLFPIFEIFM